MPEKQTIQRARQAKRSGKRPTTQASEFVREEMHHLGLSKARRAGVDLPPPGPGQAKRKTRQSARSAFRLGQEEGALSGNTPAAPRRRSTAGGRTTPRRSTSSRGSTPSRGRKTGSRTAAAGRTGRAKTRGGTSRRGSSTTRGRSSSRPRK